MSKQSTVMINCDVCSTMVEETKALRLSPQQFEIIVHEGFQPPDEALAVLMLTGNTKKSAQGWWRVNVVYPSTTDWLLCWSCAAQVLTICRACLDNRSNGVSLYTSGRLAKSNRTAVNLLCMAADDSDVARLLRHYRSLTRRARDKPQLEPDCSEVYGFICGHPAMETNKELATLQEQHVRFFQGRCLACGVKLSFWRRLKGTFNTTMFCKEHESTAPDQEAAIVRLVETLEDQDHFVQEGARNALKRVQESLPSMSKDRREVVKEALIKTGVMPPPVALPQIRSTHLQATFVQVDDDAGTGQNQFNEAIQCWNREDFDKAFTLFEEALNSGLNPTYECYAHCSLGQIQLRRENLFPAIEELLMCLETEPKTATAAWEAASRLYVIYDEANMSELASSLHGLAEAANTQMPSFRTTRGVSLEPAYENRIRELVRRSMEKPMQREIPRGGFGEPYCSAACYDQAGGAMAGARQKVAAVPCEYCKCVVGQRHVILAKQDKLVFICESCADRVHPEIQALSRCYMCDAALG